MYTAIGKNMDTSQEIVNVIQDPRLIPPDGTGYNRTSITHHELYVSCALTNRIISDPYEYYVKQFIPSIERGQFMGAHFPKNYQSTTLTHFRKVVSKLVHFPHPSNIAIIPQNEETKKPEKKQLFNSAKTVRDMKNIPVILPGIVVSHQEVLCGPTEIDHMALSYCQLLHVPIAGHQPHWCFGYEGHSYIGQRFPETSSTVPIYLDKLKIKFGLPECGLRFINDEWLIWRDYGNGGPYPLSRDNFKKFAVIDTKFTGYSTIVDCQDKTLPLLLLEKTCKLLLFRTIFRVQNTLLGNIIFSKAKNNVYSICEYVTTREVIQVSDNLLNVLFTRGSDYTPVPFSSHPIMEQIIQYLSDSENKKVLVETLLKWELLLFDLPQLPRPVLHFPTPDIVKSNIGILLKLVTSFNGS
jgi:hypothetical protein